MIADARPLLPDFVSGDVRHRDGEIDEAVVVYSSRKTLNLRVFGVVFDDTFWREIVGWAADHTAHRDKSELPPDSPEYGWECRF